MSNCFISASPTRAASRKMTSASTCLQPMMILSAIAGTGDTPFLLENAAVISNNIATTELARRGGIQPSWRLDDTPSAPISRGIDNFGSPIGFGKRMRTGIRCLVISDQAPTSPDPRRRPTKAHSRERPAGRAACARACGPAAALTSGRASVPRGKQRRATPGGSAGAARVRSADPRVPQTRPKLGRVQIGRFRCDDERSGIRSEGARG